MCQLDGLLVTSSQDPASVVMEMERITRCVYYIDISIDVDLYHDGGRHVS